MDEEKEEKKLVAALKRLEKSWPKNYWLYAASGTLCLMRKVDGQKVMEGEGFDSKYIVATFRKIESDGGDW